MLSWLSAWIQCQHAVCLLRACCCAVPAAVPAVHDVPATITSHLRSTTMPLSLVVGRWKRGASPGSWAPQVEPPAPACHKNRRPAPHPATQTLTHLPVQHSSILGRHGVPPVVVQVAQPGLPVEHLTEQPAGE